MKLKGEEIILLLFVFCLAVTSGDLIAKERQGADLLIQKKDGNKIRGELIAIKENSLLLLDTEGVDISVDTRDIKAITIVKKSKTLLGAGVGFLLGGIGGSLYATTTETYDSDLRPLAFIVYGGGGIILGALIGGITGASAGKDKTIQIEGKSDPDIREILSKLRSKARINE